jgi:hypothetical protein
MATATILPTPEGHAYLDDDLGALPTVINISFADAWVNIGAGSQSGRNDRPSRRMKSLIKKGL